MVRFKNWLKQMGFVAGLWAITQSAFAFGGELPFTSTMRTLERALQGPFLQATSVIMIIATCVMLAFGEWGDGFKKLINIVLWLSVAFAASTFVRDVFTQI